MVESKAHEDIAPVDDALPSPYPSAGGNQSDSSLSKVIQNAKAATEKEQNMSLLQGIKLYPKAVAWSVLISTCIAMEGYDISLVNNFYAFPQFKEKYGEMTPNGQQVTAPVCSLTLFSPLRGRSQHRDAMAILTGTSSGKQV